MNNIKLQPVILFFACIVCFTAHAQTNGGDTSFIYKANTALNELTSRQPTEKVYLHLDKPYYAAGDDIWFKAYLVAGEHQLSNISGALTVELISETGHVLQSIQLAIKQGLASGDFHLPYTIDAGRYHIRAYTNYMRNAGSDYFFDQPLAIAGVTGKSKDLLKNEQAMKTGTPAKTYAADADVQFFPESGNLVNGINSRVAFKAVGVNGLGLNVKGVIVDNKGIELSRFMSRHLGMGSIDITPIAGTGYTARLTFDDSSHKTINLPPALSSGYALKLANAKDNTGVIFQVSYVGNGIAKNVTDSTLNLIVRSAGSVSYAAKIRLKRSTTIGRIPKDKLATGISEFTLFTQNGEPLCERIIFVNNDDQLNIALANSNNINNTHQLTSIKLKVTGVDNKPATGSFSATVVDDNVAPDNYFTGMGNILSYFLLTSDVKGKIEAPGYYFQNNDDTTATALDLLMLTQGYRHFEWKKILNNSVPPVEFQPENGITINGHLVMDKNKPVVKGLVTFFYKPDMLLLDTVADDFGNFVFSNMIFTDSLKVVITAKTPDGKKNARVIIDKINNSAGNTTTVAVMPPIIKNAVVSLDFIPSSYRQFAVNRYERFPDNGAIMLNEVNVNTTHYRINPMASKFSSNLNGPGNADQVLTVKDIENQGGSLADILQSKVRGIIVINDTLLSGMQNTLSGKRLDNMMKVIVDGVPYAGSVKGIDPYNIESVEILRHGRYTAIYGPAVMGVVIITTKSTGDNNSNYSPAENATAVTLKGFYKAREFYSPKYDGNKADIELADMRSTIYWKPDIVTDKDGNASFNYYNAGAKSTYRIIVQGIDVNGKLGYGLLTCKVE